MLRPFLLILQWENILMRNMNKHRLALRPARSLFQRTNRLQRLRMFMEQNGNDALAALFLDGAYPARPRIGRRLFEQVYVFAENSNPRGWYG